MLFIQYPKCTTVRKAKKWLQDHEIKFEERHIIEENPTAVELKDWPEMTNEEMYQELSTAGMLVKRPILIAKDFVLVGFKEKEWEEKFL